ncbi:hypothetical protein BCD67_10895 [Oscillatoriales cyanobacterium USR001]|nr:hypothetical protein BCD67_10895 [Oscillatoriales cyanobacterium USR001]
MRFYTSILLSSLLLMGGTVKSPSIESHSTGSSDSHSVEQILATQSDNYTVQANNETEVSPERGSGR